MADILAVLYSDILRVQPEKPNWDGRDRLILSKGHSCSALYAALALLGFFPLEELRHYAQPGARLMAHASHKVPGVEFSSGSLGHGLPFGVGKALAAKSTHQPWRTYVILSDGELDEGSNWEAVLFAAHHRLGSLTVVVDHNQIQSLGSVQEVLDLGGSSGIAAKFRAFGWLVNEVDGHDHGQLRTALGQASGESPRVIIANTVKGSGVSFMEGQLLWHYKNPDEALLEKALAELGFSERTTR